MKKAICLIPDHPKLQELDERLTETRKDLDTSLSFLKKQGETLNDTFKKRWEGIWDEMIDYCKERKLLDKSHNPKKQGLHIEGGALIVYDLDEEANSIPAELKSIMSHFGFKF